MDGGVSTMEPLQLIASIDQELCMLANEYRAVRTIDEQATIAYCQKYCQLAQNVCMKTRGQYELYLLILHKLMDQLRSIYASLAPTIARLEMCQQLFVLCAKAILGIQWKQLSEDNIGKKGLRLALVATHALLSAAGYNRIELLLSLMDTHWDDPVLSKIMAEGGDYEDEEEAKAYILKEDPMVLKLRVELLLEEDCEEFVINLCQWCTTHPMLKDDIYVRQTQLLLLHKHEYVGKFREECRKISCHFGVQIVTSLEQLEQHQGICVLLAQTFLIHDWIKPNTYCCTNDLLKLWIRHQYLADKDDEKFAESVWSIAKLSRNTMQLLMLIDALKKECGQEAFLQLYTELCIYALNLDKGIWDCAKSFQDDGAIANSEKALARTCVQIYCLYQDVNLQVQQRSIITAFALDPTPEHFTALVKVYEKKYQQAMEAKKKEASETKTKMDPSATISVASLKQALPAWATSAQSSTGATASTSQENQDGSLKMQVDLGSARILDKDDKSRKKGGTVNPATVYEQDRLLKLLRPWFFNPLLPWQELYIVARDYIAHGKTLSPDMEMKIRRILKNIEDEHDKKVDSVQTDQGVMGRDQFLKQALALQKAMFKRRRGRPPLKKPETDDKEVQKSTNSLDSMYKIVYKCLICSVTYEDVQRLKEHVKSICKPEGLDNEAKPVAPTTTTMPTTTTTMATTSPDNTPPKTITPTSCQLYKCRLCNETKSSLHQFEFHLASRHAKECDGAGGNFKICHLYKCKFCKVFFNRREDLHSHLTVCMVKLRKMARTDQANANSVPFGQMPVGSGNLKRADGVKLMTSLGNLTPSILISPDGTKITLTGEVTQKKRGRKKKVVDPVCGNESVNNSNIPPSGCGAPEPHVPKKRGRKKKQPPNENETSRETAAGGLSAKPIRKDYPRRSKEAAKENSATMELIEKLLNTKEDSDNDSKKMNKGKGKMKIKFENLCQICDTKFRNRRTLTQHYAIRHIRPYKFFTNKSKNAFMCSYCNNYFETFFKYVNHIHEHEDQILQAIRNLRAADGSKLQLKDPSGSDDSDSDSDSTVDNRPARTTPLTESSDSSSSTEVEDNVEPNHTVVGNMATEESSQEGAISSNKSTDLSVELSALPLQRPPESSTVSSSTEIESEQRSVETLPSTGGDTSALDDDDGSYSNASTGGSDMYDEKFQQEVSTLSSEVEETGSEYQPSPRPSSTSAESTVDSTIEESTMEESTDVETVEIVSVKSTPLVSMESVKDIISVKSKPESSKGHVRKNATPVRFKSSIGKPNSTSDSKSGGLCMEITPLPSNWNMAYVKIQDCLGQALKPPTEQEFSNSSSDTIIPQSSPQNIPKSEESVNYENSVSEKVQSDGEVVKLAICVQKAAIRDHGNYLNVAECEKSLDVVGSNTVLTELAPPDVRTKSYDTRIEQSSFVFKQPSNVLNEESNANVKVDRMITSSNETPKSSSTKNFKSVAGDAIVDKPMNIGSETKPTSAKQVTVSKPTPAKPVTVPKPDPAVVPSEPKPSITVPTESIPTSTKARAETICSPAKVLDGAIPTPTKALVETICSPSAKALDGAIPTPTKARAETICSPSAKALDGAIPTPTKARAETICSPSAKALDGAIPTPTKAPTEPSQLPPTESLSTSAVAPLPIVQLPSEEKDDSEMECEVLKVPEKTLFLDCKHLMNMALTEEEMISTTLCFHCGQLVPAESTPEIETDTEDTNSPVTDVMENKQACEPDVLSKTGADDGKETDSEVKDGPNVSDKPDEANNLKGNRFDETRTLGKPRTNSKPPSCLSDSEVDLVMTRQTRSRSLSKTLDTRINTRRSSSGAISPQYSLVRSMRSLPRNSNMEDLGLSRATRSSRTSVRGSSEDGGLDENMSPRPSLESATLETVARKILHRNSQGRVSDTKEVESASKPQHRSSRNSSLDREIEAVKTEVIIDTVDIAGICALFAMDEVGPPDNSAPNSRAGSEDRRLQGVGLTNEQLPEKTKNPVQSEDGIGLMSFKGSDEKINSSSTFKNDQCSAVETVEDQVELQNTAVPSARSRSGGRGTEANKDAPESRDELQQISRPVTRAGSVDRTPAYSTSTKDPQLTVKNSNDELDAKKPSTCSASVDKGLVHCLTVSSVEKPKEEVIPPAATGLITLRSITRACSVDQTPVAHSTSTKDKNPHPTLGNLEGGANHMDICTSGLTPKADSIDQQPGHSTSAKDMQPKAKYPTEGAEPMDTSSPTMKASSGKRTSARFPSAKDTHPTVLKPRGRVEDEDISSPTTRAGAGRRISTRSLSANTRQSTSENHRVAEPSFQTEVIIDTVDISGICALFAGCESRSPEDSSDPNSRASSEEKTLAESPISTYEHSSPEKLDDKAADKEGIKEVLAGEAPKLHDATDQTNQLDSGLKITVINSEDNTNAVIDLKTLKTETVDNSVLKNAESDISKATDLPKYDSSKVIVKTDSPSRRPCEKDSGKVGLSAIKSLKKNNSSTVTSSDKKMVKSSEDNVIIEAKLDSADTSSPKTVSPMVGKYSTECMQRVDQAAAPGESASMKKPQNDKPKQITPLMSQNPNFEDKDTEFPSKLTAQESKLGSKNLQSNVEQSTTCLLTGSAPTETCESSEAIHQASPDPNEKLLTSGITNAVATSVTEPVIVQMKEEVSAGQFVIERKTDSLISEQTEKSLNFGTVEEAPSNVEGDEGAEQFQDMLARMVEPELFSMSSSNDVVQNAFSRPPPKGLSNDTSASATVQSDQEPTEPAPANSLEAAVDSVLNVGRELPLSSEKTTLREGYATIEHHISPVGIECETGISNCDLDKEGTEVSDRNMNDHPDKTVLSVETFVKHSTTGASRETSSDSNPTIVANLKKVILPKDFPISGEKRSDSRFPCVYISSDSVPVSAEIKTVVPSLVSGVETNKQTVDGVIADVDANKRNADHVTGGDLSSNIIDDPLAHSPNEKTEGPSPNQSCAEMKMQSGVEQSRKRKYQSVFESFIEHEAAETPVKVCRVEANTHDCTNVTTAQAAVEKLSIEGAVLKSTCNRDQLEAVSEQCITKRLISAHVTVVPASSTESTHVNTSANLSCDDIKQDEVPALKADLSKSGPSIPDNGTVGSPIELSHPKTSTRVNSENGRSDNLVSEHREMKDESSKEVFVRFHTLPCQSTRAQIRLRNRQRSGLDRIAEPFVRRQMTRPSSTNKETVDSVVTDVEMKKQTVDSVVAVVEMNQQTPDHMVSDVEMKKQTVDHVVADVETKKQTVDHVVDVEMKKQTVDVVADVEMKKQTVDHVAADVEMKKQTVDVVADVEMKKQTVDVVADVEMKKQIVDVVADVEMKKQTVDHVVADVEMKKQIVDVVADVEMKKQAVDHVVADVEMKKQTFDHVVDVEMKKQTVDDVVADVEMKKQTFDHVVADVEMNKQTCDYVVADVETKNQTVNHVVADVETMTKTVEQMVADIETGTKTVDHLVADVELNKQTVHHVLVDLMDKQTFDHVVADTKVNNQTVDHVVADTKVNKQTVDRMVADIETEKQTVDHVVADIKMNKETVDHVVADIKMNKETVDHVVADVESVTQTVEHVVADVEPETQTVDHVVADVGITKQTAGHVIADTQCDEVAVNSSTPSEILIAEGSVSAVLSDKGKEPTTVCEVSARTQESALDSHMDIEPNDSAVKSKALPDTEVEVSKTANTMENLTVSLIIHDDQSKLEGNMEVSAENSSSTSKTCLLSRCSTASKDPVSESLPASPSPEEPVKRKRGRPRKEESPEQEVSKKRRVSPDSSMLKEEEPSAGDNSKPRVGKKRRFSLKPSKMMTRQKHASTAVVVVRPKRKRASAFLENDDYIYNHPGRKPNSRTLEKDKNDIEASITRKNKQNLRENINTQQSRNALRAVRKEAGNGRERRNFLDKDKCYLLGVKKCDEPTQNETNIEQRYGSRHMSSQQSHMQDKKTDEKSSPKASTGSPTQNQVEKNGGKQSQELPKERNRALTRRQLQEADKKETCVTLPNTPCMETTTKRGRSVHCGAGAEVRRSSRGRRSVEKEMVNSKDVPGAKIEIEVERVNTSQQEVSESVTSKMNTRKQSSKTPATKGSSSDVTAQKQIQLRTAAKEQPLRHSKQRTPTRTAAKVQSSEQSKQPAPPKTAAKVQPLEQSKQPAPARTVGKEQSSQQSKQPTPSKIAAREQPLLQLKQSTPTTRTAAKVQPLKQSKQPAPTRTVGKEQPLQQSEQPTPSKVAAQEQPLQQPKQPTPLKIAAKEQPLEQSEQPAQPKTVWKEQPLQQSQQSTPTTRTAAKVQPLELSKQPTPPKTAAKEQPLEQSKQPAQPKTVGKEQPLQQSEQSTPSKTAVKVQPLEQSKQPTPTRTAAKEQPLQQSKQSTPTRSAAKVQAFEQSKQPTPTRTTAKVQPLEQSKQPTPTRTAAKEQPLQQSKQPTPARTAAKVQPLEQSKQPTPTRTTAKVQPLEQSKQPTPTKTAAKEQPLQQSKQSTPARSAAKVQPLEQSKQSTPTRTAAKEQPLQQSKQPTPARTAAKEQHLQQSKQPTPTRTAAKVHLLEQSKQPSLPRTAGKEQPFVKSSQPTPPTVSPAEQSQQSESAEAKSDMKVVPDGIHSNVIIPENVTKVVADIQLQLHEKQSTDIHTGDEQCPTSLQSSLKELKQQPIEAEASQPVECKRSRRTRTPPLKLIQEMSSKVVKEQGIQSSKGLPSNTSKRRDSTLTPPLKLTPQTSVADVKEDTQPPDTLPCKKSSTPPPKPILVASTKVVIEHIMRTNKYVPSNRSKKRKYSLTRRPKPVPQAAVKVVMEAVNLPDSLPAPPPNPILETSMKDVDKESIQDKSVSSNKSKLIDNILNPPEKSVLEISETLVNEQSIQTNLCKLSGQKSDTLQSIQSGESSASGKFQQCDLLTPPSKPVPQPSQKETTEQSIQSHETLSSDKSRKSDNTLISHQIPASTSVKQAKQQEMQTNLLSQPCGSFHSKSNQKIWTPTTKQMDRVPGTLEPQKPFLETNAKQMKEQQIQTNVSVYASQFLRGGKNRSEQWKADENWRVQRCTGTQTIAYFPKPNLSSINARKQEKIKALVGDPAVEISDADRKSNFVRMGRTMSVKSRLLTKSSKPFMWDLDDNGDPIGTAEKDTGAKPVKEETMKDVAEEPTLLTLRQSLRSKNFEAVQKPKNFEILRRGGPHKEVNKLRSKPSGEEQSLSTTGSLQESSFLAAKRAHDNSGFEMINRTATRRALNAQAYQTEVKSSKGSGFVPVGGMPKSDINPAHRTCGVIPITPNVDRKEGVNRLLTQKGVNPNRISTGSVSDHAWQTSRVNPETGTAHSRKAVNWSPATCYTYNSGTSWKTLANPPVTKSSNILIVPYPANAKLPLKGAKTGQTSTICQPLNTLLTAKTDATSTVQNLSKTGTSDSTCTRADNKSPSVLSRNSPVDHDCAHSDSGSSNDDPSHPGQKWKMQRQSGKQGFNYTFTKARIQ